MAALAVASTAHATATLYLFDGTAADNKTVLDEGVGDQNTGMVGVVGFNGAVGSTWTVNVVTGQTKPALGSASQPSLDLNFVDTSSGAGTITIAFFDSGFTPTLAGAIASIGGTTTGVSVNYSTYHRAGSAAATLNGSSTGLDLSSWTQLTSQNFTSSPFSGSANGGPLSIGQDGYELLQVVTITTRVAGASSGDASLAAPDGGMTLMLLGSSLTGLAFLRRSFKPRKA